MNFQQGNLEPVESPRIWQLMAADSSSQRPATTRFTHAQVHFHSMQTAIWLIRRREISCSGSGLWVTLMESILHFRLRVTPESIFLWEPVLQESQHSRSHCPATCRRLAKGPVAQSLATTAPFLAGGLPITTSTRLVDLDNNTPKYVLGDRIIISGTKSDGSDPDLTELTVDPSTDDSWRSARCVEYCLSRGDSVA